MFQPWPAGGFTPVPPGYGSQSIAYPAQNPGGYYAQFAPPPMPPEARSAAPPQYDADRLRIAVIDNFNPDNDPVFHGAGSHGAYITQLIRSGGSDPRLAGRIDTLTYDAGQPGAGAETTSTGRILDALNDVYMRAMNGDRIDAVNLSQAAFGEGSDYPQIREAIERLRAIDIPVSIAAGNQGPQNENQLATAGQFEVEALQNGMRKADSGLGNIQAEGEYTSYAAANLAPLLAARHRAGMGIDQIKQEAAYYNGSLPPGVMNPAYMAGPGYNAPPNAMQAYAATQPNASNSREMMDSMMSMFMMLVALVLGGNGQGQSAADSPVIAQQAALQQGVTQPAANPQQIPLQQGTTQQPMATQRIA